MAEAYDRRRFAGAGGRRKQRRDEWLVGQALAGCATVLDVPTGTGRLLPVAGRAVGADLSLPMLLAGREVAPEAPRVVADASRLPFADGAFDAVLSWRFFFHVRDPDLRRAILVELARVARRRVVVQVRYRATLKHLGRFLRSRVGLARRYRPAPDRAALVAEFEAAGLVVRAVRPVSRLFSDKALVIAEPRPGQGQVQS